jgi:hypothetical protein
MKHIVIAVLGYLYSTTTLAQPAVLIAHYPFTGDVSTVGIWNNLVLSSAGPMYAGSGLAAVGYVNGQFAFPDRAKWATNWTLNGLPLDLNDHFGCQLVPQAGYVLIIDSVTFKIRRSSTAPDTVEFRMSTTPVFLPFWKAKTGPTDAWRSFSITSGFTPAASAVNLRVYGRNATGTGGAMRLDDFKVYAHLQNVYNLPIELLSFTGHKTLDGVELNWTTATERENDYFTLLRSADAENCEPIGFVDGAGNSTSAISYSFVDDEPLPGLNYYQLKQTDWNGDSTLSHVVAVQFSNMFTLTHQSGSSISWDDKYIQVLDIAGRSLSAWQQSHILSIPGTYILVDKQGAAVRLNVTP